MPDSSNGVTGQLSLAIQGAGPWFTLLGKKLVGLVNISVPDSCSPGASSSLLQR